MAPYEGETVFVAKPADRRLEEQREKVLLLLDRGSLTFVLFSGIMLVIALITTISRGPSWPIWLASPALFLCALGMYLWMRRMEEQPTEAVEVPEYLSEMLNDSIALYGELRVVVTDELESEDRVEVLADAEEHLDDALGAAAKVLPALEEGDEKAAERAEAEAGNSARKLEELAEEFGVTPRALGAQEFVGQELPSEDEESSRTDRKELHRKKRKPSVDDETVALPAVTPPSVPRQKARRRKGRPPGAKGLR